MMTLSKLLLVAAGGFVGATARYLLSTFVSTRFPTMLPYGTLTINAIGSFLIGIVAGHAAPESVRLIIAVGFMGAFTTFSTFNLESVRLARRKAWAHFAAYIALTYILGILFAFIGLYYV
ncbi:fluoride efflux transporter CrcB [Paenibacillus chartarius]|uniref:Fluoride-specific ion channel FluC n=1 Tax=Paenibacillus chartarius TaxID=747481 RepID=A0ABV6DKJ0_9BACL